MAAWDPATGVILAIIIGTLGAIVYSLRILVLLERRIARIDAHLEMVVKRIIREELAIEAEEKKLESEIKGMKTKRKSARRSTKKKSKRSTKKKSKRTAKKKSKRKSSRRR